jgi:hypothetical protein
MGTTHFKSALAHIKGGNYATIATQIQMVHVLDDVNFHWAGCARACLHIA